VLIQVWKSFEMKMSSRVYNTGQRSQERAPVAFGEAMLGNWKTAGLAKASVFKPVFTTVEQLHDLTPHDAVHVCSPAVAGAEEFDARFSTAR
jgi:hypothetical protein